MTSPIDNAIYQLSRMPSIGEKTATRLIYWLLSQDPEVSLEIGRAICELPTKLQRCITCFSLSEENTCSICQDTKRSAKIICVVETPKDIGAIESTGEFEGTYHVLDGLISPQKGIEAQHLRIRELLERLRNGDVEEVFVATNPTLEGDLTATYLCHALKGLNLQVTRLAGGVPVGSELEYANTTTVAHAINNRQPMF